MDPDDHPDETELLFVLPINYTEDN